MNHREQMRRRLGSSIKPAKYTNAPADALASSIELKIERLVFEGIAPEDRDRIADAVRSELELLFADTNTGAAPNFIAPVNERRIDAGTIKIDHGTPDLTVGKQIAHAIHDGIGAATNPGGKRQPS
jgi:hypothetical protein